MKVSVVVPVYKVEHYIERCVRALMEQTFQDAEFIFVDDASPDGSMDIVKKVTSEYNKNVRFLSHNQNKGLPAARNTNRGIYLPLRLRRLAGGNIAGENG